MLLDEIDPPACTCDVSEVQCAFNKINFTRALLMEATDALAHATDKLTFTGDFDAVAEIAGLIPGVVGAMNTLDRLGGSDVS